MSEGRLDFPFFHRKHPAVVSGQEVSSHEEDLKSRFEELSQYIGVVTGSIASLKLENDQTMPRETHPLGKEEKQFAKDLEMELLRPLLFSAFENRAVIEQPVQKFLQSQLQTSQVQEAESPQAKAFHTAAKETAGVMFAFLKSPEATPDAYSRFATNMFKHLADANINRPFDKALVEYPLFENQDFPGLRKAISTSRVPLGKFAIGEHRDAA